MASVLLLLIGAMGFYFYTRILYTEKKISLLETILLDIKMMLEMEDFQPSASSPLKYEGASKKVSIEEKVEILEPVNLEKNDVEEVKDETEYYNSVIESVAAESALPDTNQVTDSSVANVAVTDEYDSMTRDQLVASAEKKGLKVTKRTQRQTIVNLLRESDKNTSGKVELGTDGAPADGGAALDGAEELSSESL